MIAFGPLITPVSFYKDPTKILEKFPKYPIMSDNWSIHDLELILLTGFNNVQMAVYLDDFFYKANERNLHLRYSFYHRDFTTVIYCHKVIYFCLEKYKYTERKKPTYFSTEKCWYYIECSQSQQRESLGIRLNAYEANRENMGKDLDPLFICER